MRGRHPQPQPVITAWIAYKEAQNPRTACKRDQVTRKTQHIPVQLLTVSILLHRDSIYTHQRPLPSCLTTPVPAATTALAARPAPAVYVLQLSVLDGITCAHGGIESRNKQRLCSSTNSRSAFFFEYAVEAVNPRHRCHAAIRLSFLASLTLSLL